MFRRVPFLVFIAAALLISAPMAVRADGHGIVGSEGVDDDNDHDRARDLRERGEIAPLHEILARVAVEFPGDVMSVGLGRQGGRWVYRIRILAEGGKLVDLDVDAKSIDVMPREGGD